MEPLWKVEGLRKEYRVRTDFAAATVRAVDGVDLAVARGETLGVVGESGCGKSTLGKLMVRLIEPTAGRILFDGADVGRLPERRLAPLRRRFQVVFQDPFRSLNPRMAAGPAVMEGMARTLPRRDRRARALELFETVGVAARKFDDYPHRFSGGEKQRISIARALASGPEAVVCDEPTSNLDVSIQAQILNLFLDLKERFGLTYLFISHDLKVVEFIADRIAVMYRGRVVETGPAGAILADPVHPYTRLLTAAAFFRAEKAVLREDAPRGCPFHGRCPDARPECAGAVPELRRIAPDHAAACHRAKPRP